MAEYLWIYDVLLFNSTDQLIEGPEPGDSRLELQYVGLDERTIKG